MSRSGVPEVDLERLPHRHAVIRLRQAYGKLRQLEAAVTTSLPKPERGQAKETIQEVNQ